MNERDIIKNLKRFGAIEPEKGYTAQSRFLILSAPRLARRIPVTRLVFNMNYFLRAGSLVGLGVVLIVAAYAATRELSPLFLPGLNQNRIVAEADMINSTIDIELQRVNYFEKATKEGTLALTQVTTASPDHLTAEVIEKEADQIEALLPEQEFNQEINDILNQINEQE